MASQRMQSGKTERGVGWNNDGKGVSITVDTSSGSYTQVPFYLATLDRGGDTSKKMTTDISVFNPTETGFTVYVELAGSGNLKQNDAGDWCVNWIGVGL